MFLVENKIGVMTARAKYEYQMMRLVTVSHISNQLLSLATSRNVRFQVYCFSHQYPTMASFLTKFLDNFSQGLGIDLGTANTLVGIANKGVVLREPSIVCRHKKSKNIIAVGTSAKKMLGRVPASIEVLKPLKDGVIADYDLTSAMLGYFVEKINHAFGKRFFSFGPRAVIGVPSNISKVERRAVIAAALKNGMRSAYLLEEPMAAAIGAGLPVGEPVGSMIVNIGGGTCEIAIISLGGVVTGRSLKVAGNAMDEDITNYVRSRWGVIIGEAAAEEIKLTLGSAFPAGVEKDMVVRGRDLEKGLPRSIKVTQSAVREALAPSVAKIVAAVRETLEDTPPELLADIAERGIVICGGGALLPGLAKLISQETKLPVILADDPMSSVVLGTMRVIENDDLFKKVKVAES